MSNHLGEYFHTEMKMQMLSLSQVARMLGYRNVNKGIRKILQFEREGTIKPDLLVRFAEVLGVDWQIVEELAEQDHQDRLRAWEEWANEPVPMRLVVRLIPGVYSEKQIPQDITTQEQAEKWACDFALNHHLRVCLVVSRRLSVWIGSDGTIEMRTESQPDEPNEPYMYLKNAKRRFLLNFGEEDVP